MPVQTVKIGDATLRLGDCLTVLRTLPEASVHCCVTSPPYYGLRDYGVAGQIGLEHSFESYIERMVEVFREVRRVLRPDATAWLNLGDCYASNPASGGRSKSAAFHGSPSAESDHATPFRRWARPDGLKPKDLMMMPARVALALQADGWWLRSEIIWHKPNPMPESVRDRPTSAHEKIFLLSPSERYFYDADAIRQTPTGRTDPIRSFSRGSLGSGHTKNYQLNGSIGANKRNVWTVATTAFKGAHFATFPPAIIEPCILAGTSEHGVCAECGAQWMRIVERTKESSDRLSRGKAITSPRQDGNSWNENGGRGFMPAKTAEIGWRPSCSCDAGIVPATVLDPFVGAGTTALVAGRLGRQSVGIELNADYLDIACRRIEAAQQGHNDSLMSAKAAA